MTAIAASAPIGASLPASTMPTTDAAMQPAAIRNGNQAAKNAYRTGMAFEQILDNQLAQEMTSTISPDGSGGDGLGGTSDSGGSGGSTGGADAGLGAYSSLLPQSLSQAMLGGGGTGIAMQIARSIDPALNGATK